MSEVGVRVELVRTSVRRSGRELSGQIDRSGSGPAFHSADGSSPRCLQFITLEGVMSWCAETPESFRSNCPQRGPRAKVTCPGRGCRGRVQTARAAHAASTGTAAGMPCASCWPGGGNGARGGGRPSIPLPDSRTGSPRRRASAGSGGSRLLQDLVMAPARRETLGRAHRPGRRECSRSPVRSGSTAPARRG